MTGNGRNALGLVCIPPVGRLPPLMQVHALLVGNSSNPAVDALASDTHVFRSWSAVDDRVRR